MSAEKPTNSLSRRAMILSTMSGFSPLATLTTIAPASIMSGSFQHLSTTLTARPRASAAAGGPATAAPLRAQAPRGRCASR